MKPLFSIKALGWTLVILLGVAAWQLVTGGSPRARGEFRDTVRQLFPEQARAAAAGYGLKAFRTPGAGAGRRPVVLVHGLDDPGKVWMNLAPALDDAGYGVWQMRYPDDQPILDSARLLRRELATLRASGIERLDLVAHSMGGLVSRELLTSPELREGEPLPRVGRLIMLGTPNHGSELARLRALAEVRDQFADLLAGEFSWLGWIFDGAGEAGLDLLPGSEFLRRLNARPPPVGVRLTVIAAVLEQVERQRLLERLPVSGLSGPLASGLDLVEDLLAQVGDGLVTVESARLPGAGFHLVEGNHLSMVRNVLESSTRVPPAIPLVLRLLGEPD